VTVLAGVGRERAGLLGRLGIRTAGDLLFHRPRRYEDRRRVQPIGDLRLGEVALAHGRIVAQGVKRWRQGQRSMFELVLEDDSGRLYCRWWNQRYLEGQYETGDEVFVFGRLRSLKPRALDHPETEVIDGGAEGSIHLHRIVPVYALTEGVTQRWLRALVWRTLPLLAPAIPDPNPGIEVPDLPGRAEAVRALHFPAEAADAEAGRRRLALDEFVGLQVEIQRRRRRMVAKTAARPCAGDNHLMRPFLRGLGFPLTAAQTRVLREIRRDIGGTEPMRRLLQGDVGSGKTVVAACAALMAIESGFSVGLMAPTEVLADQHTRTFRRWFDPLGIPVRFWTGSRKEEAVAGAPPSPPTPDAETADAGGLPCAGAGVSPSLTVGTHALVESGYVPERLGLVVIDEQHKFGVAQREELVRKGRHPHLLVMTATPIPRTLGLTLYGDLDVSVLDQMPGGRGRTRTFVRGVESLAKVWAFVRAQIARGRQAYVVYPRVEETGQAGGLKSVQAEHRRLETEFAPSRVALLHGRLPPAEKESVLEAFRANEAQVLVATSVIEVGLDVPNATVMVIENADSYGLAQLHQLRGRIGRGPHEAYCILLAGEGTPEARRRLHVLAETADGFRIAEADLAQRGPGELLGQAQSGLPQFRFADLTGDLDLVLRARTLVARAPNPPSLPIVPGAGPIRGSGLGGVGADG
jgi:ATP-dependent DNA helicase RecG